MPETIAQRRLHAIALLVPDYDQAIDWYVEVMGFDLVEDTPLSPGKRWVLVSAGEGSNLLLAKASNDRQRAAIGDQAGGRVMMILHTDDFARDQAYYEAHGAQFEEEPRHEPYGIVAVFRDIFGNRWDLIQPSQ